MIPSPNTYIQVPGLSRPIRLIQPEGRGSCGVGLVGEAGGTHEQRELLSFRPWAEAGSVLAAAIRRLGVKRSSFLITNCVWWQPPQNYLVGAPWERESIEMCRGWNQQLFRRLKLKCLVALGATAFHELTGLDDFGVLNCRGYVYPAKSYYDELPVVYTYHPSFLARGSKEKNEDTGGKTEKAEGGGMALLGVLVRDLRLARGVAIKGCPPSWPPKHLRPETAATLPGRLDDDVPF